MQSGDFVVEARLEGGAEALKIPILRPTAPEPKRVLAGATPAARALLQGPIGSSSSAAAAAAAAAAAGGAGGSNGAVIYGTPRAADTLETLLQRIGSLLGRDPSRWEQVGEPTSDVATSDDGTKRVTTHTGVFAGTELRLWAAAPHYDPRLPPRPGRPDLTFDAPRREVRGTDEWRRLIADQPWTPGRRRRMLLKFLTAKLQADDPVLQLEGAVGAWELAVCRDAHADAAADPEALQALLDRLTSPDAAVARACACAVWGLAVSEGPRRLLANLGATEALAAAARRTLLPAPQAAAAAAADPAAVSDRDGLQAAALGALAVLLVDRGCREPLVAAEPACDTLLALCRDAPGHPQPAWLAARREAAARAVAALTLRDADARRALVASGGALGVLDLLMDESPGSERAQYWMASLLGALALDREAMEALRRRGDAPAMFRATLRVLGRALARLKDARAVDVAAAAAAATAEAAGAQQQGAGDAAAGGSSSASGATTMTAAEVDATVALANACAQGMWGAAHHCLAGPTLEVTQAHAVELGGLALDCLLLTEAPLDLGRACHCVAAALASLAAHEPCARFIMDAPGGSVVRAVLALVDAGDDDAGFSHAPDVRAAGCTALAFLACHPLGARGDDCLAGPFRARLLQAGALGALLRAALASSGAGGRCDAIVQQTAAVGIMYLSTVAGAVDAAELAMYAALMTSNANVEMVEYLMAGMWMLIKVPANRKALGSAFQVNPASSKLASQMVEKLQDTIEVADVTEHVARIAERASRARAATTGAGNGGGGAGIGDSGGGDPFQGQRARDEGSFFAAAAGSPVVGEAQEEEGSHGNGAVEPAGNWAAPQAREGLEADALNSPRSSSRVAANDSGAGPAGAPAHAPALERAGSGASMRSLGAFSTGGGRRPGGITYGELAAAAPALDDKLAIVEHKRRSALLLRLADLGDEGGPAAADGPASPSTSSTRRAAAAAAAAPSPDGAVGKRLSGVSVLSSLTGSGGALGSHLSAAMSSSNGGGPADRGIARVRQLSNTFSSLGAPSRATVDGVRAIDAGVDRSVHNLDEQLGSSLGEDWGLDTLVRVGEIWLPRMLAAGAGDGAGPPAPADVPLLKLFEFLVASMCLYVVDEDAPPPPPPGAFARVGGNSSDGDGGSGGGAAGWWTVAATRPDAPPVASALMQRTLAILLASLQLRASVAWKSVQLAVVMLWNAAAHSAAAERHLIEAGAAGLLLAVAEGERWPPTLRDMAAGALQHLLESARGLAALGSAAESSSEGGGGGADERCYVTAGRGAASKRASSGAKFVTARDRANQAAVAAALALVPGAATSAKSINGGGGTNDDEATDDRESAQRAAEAERRAALDAAAGEHRGFIPFMRAMAALIATRHPLLELRGARGIARACFAPPAYTGADDGTAAASAASVLRAAKATAAEVGAVGALAGLVRRAAARYLAVLGGERPPAPPVLSALAAEEYALYARDMSGRAASLELLHAAAAALLNLSTLPANRPKVAARALSALLGANTSLYAAIMAQPTPDEAELRLLDALAAAAANLARHPANRSRLYRAELRGSTAMGAALAAAPTTSSGDGRRGGAASASAATGAAAAPSRDALLASTAAGAAGAAARLAAARGVDGEGINNVATESPGANAARSASACGLTRRSPSPAAVTTAKRASRRSASGSPPCARRGAAGALVQRVNGGSGGAAEALAAAGEVRPKGLFPAAKEPRGHAAEDRVLAGLQGSLPAAGCCTDGAEAAHGPASEATQECGSSSAVDAHASPSGGGGRSKVGALKLGRSKSLRSLAAGSLAGVSVAVAPGSPTAPPDGRDEFLIWLDNAFADGSSGSGSGSDDGYGSGGESRARHRRACRADRRNGGGSNSADAAGAAAPACKRPLQRLLCRPLHYLWQESPEALARRGAARWAPPVSEYREAPTAPAPGTAARLLAASPPPGVVPRVVEATARLLATGELGAVDLAAAAAAEAPADAAAVGEVVAERPSTRERAQGCCPLTVLRPRPGEVAAAVAKNATAVRSGKAAAAGATILEEPLHEQRQRGGDREELPQAALNDDHDGDGSGNLTAQQQQQQQPTVGLAVALSPQRGRTLFAFEPRPPGSGGGGGPGGAPAGATLTLFEHVPGARVGEGLFVAYDLPNGRRAYMYCDGAGGMDEAEIGPVVPPPRPTTVPLALQQSMPLAEVLDMIAQPPGSAPPYVPPRPVPRLVPLPARHTLPVRRPDRLDAAAFGALREDSLQLVIEATAVLRTATATTEEEIAVAAPVVRPAWALPESVFRARAKEADARAFYDGGATISKAFERDFGRMAAKDKFAAMLARENRASSAGRTDKAALAAVHDAVARHYAAVAAAFTYYAAASAGGGGDPHHLSLNGFTAFLDDAGVPDPDSAGAKRSDCDTAFIVSVFVADKKSAEYAVLDEHAMMRFQFLEAIVRIAIAKYGRGQQTDDPATAVEMLLTQDLPRVPPQARLDPNEFRAQRAYTEEVDLTLRRNQAMLKALYSRYRLKPAGGGLRPMALRLDGWLALLNDARLIDAQFTTVDAVLAFQWSRMAVVDEVKDYARCTALTFTDFLEALGRVADAKSLPTASELDEAGFGSVLEWALEKERLEGSGDSGSGSGGNDAQQQSTSGAAQPAQPAAPTAAGARRMSTTGGGGGGGGGALPPIFRTRPSARFGAPKPRPLYAKLDMLLDLLYRRLHFDPAEPGSAAAFNADALLRAVKRADKELGP